MRVHLPQPKLPIGGGAPTTQQTYVFTQTAQPDRARFLALQAPRYQPWIALRSDAAAVVPSVDASPYFIGQPLMKIRYVIPQNRTWVHGLTVPVVQTQTFPLHQPDQARFAVLQFGRYAFGRPPQLEGIFVAPVFKAFWLNTLNQQIGPTPQQPSPR